MPLQKQLVAVPFSGGLDQKTDEKWVGPGRLLLLENGRFTKAGRISLRPGYVDLSDLDTAGNTIGMGDALGEFDSELLKFAGPSLYGWSSAAERWVSKGTITPLITGGKPISATTAAQTMPHAGIANGQTLYAWEDGRGGVRCSVIDDATGAFLIADQELNASAATPVVASYANNIVVLYRVSGTLYSRVYNPGTVSLGAETSAATDARTSDCYMDVVSANGQAVVVYRTSGNAVKIAYLLDTGAFAGVGDGFPIAATIAEDPDNFLSVAFREATGQTWLCWHRAAVGLRGAVLGEDFSTILAATTIDADTDAKRNGAHVFVSDTQIRWYYEHEAAAVSDQLIYENTLEVDGTAGSRSVFKRSVGLAGKAFTEDSTAYLPLVHDSALQSTYFIADTSGAIIAKARALQAGGLTAKPGLPPVLSSVDSVWRFPALSKNKLVSDDNDVYSLTGVWETSLDFRAPAQHYNAQLGGNLHITGGALYAYDGLGPVEAGFHLFPEGPAALAASTGGSMEDGSYQYKALYEWSDNYGQIHRSAPSVAVTEVLATGLSTQKITVTVPMLRLTAKTSPRGEVSIVLYRTNANGTVFRRVTSISAPEFNDPTADSVDIVDTDADATIAANEILYTTGGVLENIGPPAGSLIATSKTRVFMAGLEDGYRILYSKEQVRGEGAEFNDALEIRLSATGGRETAIAVMDERLIIFRDALIEYLPGDGPDNTGADNTFGRPQLVTSDAGCVNPASIVAVPQGLMFESAKGIYLLTRNFQVQYLGAPVEDFNGLTITSGDLLKTENMVVFLTSDGVTLAYDYYFDAWATWTNHQGSDALVWGGVYHYLSALGPVKARTQNAFTDNGSAIRLKIRTPWLRVNEIQGFQRVRSATLLGTYKSPHSLVMRAAYDYKPFSEEEASFAANTVLDAETTWGGNTVWGEIGTVWGGVVDNVYQFQWYLPQQRCQALQLEFESFPVADENPGEGLDLAALTLNAGVKRGMNKMRTVKQAG